MGETFEVRPREETEDDRQQTCTEARLDNLFGRGLIVGRVRGQIGDDLPKHHFERALRGLAPGRPVMALEAFDDLGQAGVRHGPSWCFPRITVRCARLVEFTADGRRDFLPC